MRKTLCFIFVIKYQFQMTTFERRSSDDMEFHWFKAVGDNAHKSLDWIGSFFQSLQRLDSTWELICFSRCVIRKFMTFESSCQKRSNDFSFFFYLLLLNNIYVVFFCHFSIINWTLWFHLRQRLIINRKFWDNFESKYISTKHHRFSDFQNLRPFLGSNFISQYTIWTGAGLDLNWRRLEFWHCNVDEPKIGFEMLVKQFAISILND